MPSQNALGSGSLPVHLFKRSILVEPTRRGPVAQLPGAGGPSRYRKTRAADTCSAPARCWQCISSAGARSTSFGGVYNLDPACRRQTGK